MAQMRVLKMLLFKLSGTQNLLVGSCFENPSAPQGSVYCDQLCLGFGV